MPLMKALKNLIFISVLCLMGSCYYDEPPKPAEIDPDLVFFSSSIIPIMDKACNNPGCHNTDEVPPDLTAEKAYDALVGGGYVNTTVPKSSELYLRMTGTEAGPIMPPGGRLPATDIELVLAWINKGALND